MLPPGVRVAYDSAGVRTVGVSQQIWILDGGIELTVGDVTHRLEAGDCIAMRLDRPVAFHNPSDRDARYVVALATDFVPPSHGATVRGSLP